MPLSSPRCSALEGGESFRLENGSGMNTRLFSAAPRQISFLNPWLPIDTNGNALSFPTSLVIHSFSAMQKTAFYPRMAGREKLCLSRKETSILICVECNLDVT